jgi:hypothetical protein
MLIELIVEQNTERAERMKGVKTRENVHVEMKEAEPNEIMERGIPVPRALVSDWTQNRRQESG